jgi:hypothetical protein
VRQADSGIDGRADVAHAGWTLLDRDFRRFFKSGMVIMILFLQYTGLHRHHENSGRAG